MRLTTPLAIINNSLNDLQRINDLNYLLPKVTFNEYWDDECTLNPTDSHYKVFDN